MENFTFTFTNPTSEDQSLALFNPTKPTSQVTRKYRVVTDYKTVYAAPTRFSIVTSLATYSFVSQENLTPEQFVDFLNAQYDIGIFSLFANNAVDGTVYEVQTPQIFLSIEIDDYVATWSQLTSGVSSFLYDVFFIDADNGWACGLLGTILKTTDGGATWNPQISGVGAIDLQSIFFIDANNGWACGQSGTIINTTDGGTTWNPQTSSTTQTLRSIFFIDANIGWCVGGNALASGQGRIRKTTDGGATWNSMPDQANTMLKVFFIDANNGWTSNAEPYSGSNVYYTTDGGATWNDSNLVGVFDLLSIFFTSALVGYTVGTNERIYKTIDGGINWTQKPISLPGTILLEDISFIDQNNGWICGASGTILKTIDAGETWEKQNSNFSSSLHSIFMVNNFIGYACGSNGIILKYS